MLQALAATWWAAPLAMCLVLTGIHGYLGIHVLMRKVIFVDLAMAQIAALGAAYAVLLGYEPGRPGDGLPIYLFSLGFTLVGAAVIALTRMRHERVPHEAFIGIVYASASALAMLLLSKSTSEGEQIRHMLAGSLLTVRWPKVLTTAGIYSVILAFHWVFRRKFFRVSADSEAAERAGIPVRLWDFVFYVTFGIVITSSVAVAGVLLVFCYLVIPAAIGVMFARRTRVRVLIAWGVGTLVSVVGILVSYTGDFPTGPSIVAGATATLILAGLVHYVATHGRRAFAAGWAALAAGIAVLAVWGTTYLEKAPERHEHREDEFTRILGTLQSDDLSLQLHAIDHIAGTKDVHAADPLMELLRRTRSDQVIEHAAKALAELQAARAVPLLQEVATRDLDPLLRVEIARAILDLRDPSGIGILIDVLETTEARIPREDANALIEERTGVKVDLGEIEALREWWVERGESLRWRGETRRFE
ncbi:MAG: metal ABC transporter permease [Acidobacteria bacterium]|nr:metal ABC transporter permease [Acidobacteriota bacterium]